MPILRFKACTRLLLNQIQKKLTLLILDFICFTGILQLLLLRFFANFFSVWDMNEYCTVAVCHNGSKKRPERVSGNYHSKIKGPREILDSSVTSPG